MLSGQQQQVEWLVLVDDNDKELGLDTRENCHKGGIRRSKQELSADVKKLDRKLDYTYWAKFGDYSENEFCVLLTGNLEGPAKPNPDEIMETKNVTMKELGADMSKSPEKYTPWFKIAFEKYARQNPR